MSALVYLCLYIDSIFTWIVTSPCNQWIKKRMYHSAAPEFVLLNLQFCGPLFIVLIIVLSVLRFTPYDDPFGVGVFKQFPILYPELSFLLCYTTQRSRNDNSGQRMTISYENYFNNVKNLAIVVMIVWQLDLQLLMQSVPLLL